MDYDIIGDIHGQDGKLTALLAALGYRIRNGAYRHPEDRMALFLGDLIDRGPGQVKVVRIIRDMIEAGSARTIMGNHEWNAIGFGTPRPDGFGYLRSREGNKRKDHAEFLMQVGEDSALHRELVAWFKTLPPFLDLGNVRLCHAWWNQRDIDCIRAAMNDSGQLDEDFLIASFEKKSPTWEAMEHVTKGFEILLPVGSSFRDPSGYERTEIRVRWWDGQATTYRQAALVPERDRENIPEIPLPRNVTLGVETDVPTFVGHYWLTGTPGIQHATMAVLDYSAAKAGPLVAYRWNGEPVLSDDNLVWVAN